MDNPVEVLSPAGIYTANELCVWKVIPDDIEPGFYPVLTCLPNPVIQDDLIVATLFSPRQVWALEKSTGQRRWSHNLNNTFGMTTIAAADFLFVNNGYSLLSLSPQTGKPQWEFSSKKKDQGFLAMPVFANGSVYIGNENGRFYSVSAETGKELWSVQPSRSWNNGVHATALVFEDLIITACNARLALAYDQVTGQEIWRRRLPAGSIYQIQWYEGMVLIQTRKGLFGLAPRTGEILQKWQWRGQKIESVAVAGSTLCLVISNEPGHEEKMPLHPKTELLGIQGDRIQWRLPYPRKSGIDLRWDHNTRLLYETMYCGLGIVDPETGTRQALISGFSSGVGWDNISPNDRIELPCTENRVLYILHTSGTIWALRHP